MSDRFARIQLAQLRINRLEVEAKGCADLDRLTAIRREMEVIYDSVVAIREEQLMEQLDPPKKPKPRRWWQFWAGSEEE